MTTTEQLDTILHALAEGDHDTAEAVADLSPEDVPDEPHHEPTGEEHADRNPD